MAHHRTFLCIATITAFAKHSQKTIKWMAVCTAIHVAATFVAATVGLLPATCNTATAQTLEYLPSEDFVYKYEMDDLPSTLDLDSNGVFDILPYGGAPTCSGGILAIPNNVYYESPKGTGNSGIWENNMTFEAGYTIEARLKIIEHADGAVAFMLSAAPPDAATTGAFGVAATGEGWGQSATNLGTSNDNADDFHVFRMAKMAGSNNYWLWRDDVLLGHGLASLSGSANDFWFGDGSGGWGGISEVDYLRITPGAYSPTEPMVIPTLSQKASSDFTWKYEMDVSPQTQDLDANESPDLAFFEDTPITVGSNILSYTSTGIGLTYIYSATGGIWDGKCNYDDGYSIEVRLKVNGDGGGSDGMAAIFASTADTNECANLRISSTGQTWGNWALGATDNSDGFHVFRVVKVPGIDQYRVWRDGVLLADDLLSGDSITGEELWFGDITKGSGSASDVEIDYIRIIDGAFAPPSVVLLPGDANGDGVVNGVDAAALAANWQKASGATWAEGDFNDD